MKTKSKADEILDRLTATVDARMAELSQEDQADRVKRLKAYSASLRQKARTTSRKARESEDHHRVSRRSA